MGGAVVSPANLLDFAGCLANAAEAAAREEGIFVCISVVDPHARPVLFRRMDGSSLVAIDMAIGKAKTSVALEMCTADLTPLIAPGQPLFPLVGAAGGKYILFGGGVPVTHVDGTLIAGLGVSGGTPDQDHAVASQAASNVSPSEERSLSEVKTK